MLYWMRKVLNIIQVQVHILKSWGSFNASPFGWYRIGADPYPIFCYIIRLTELFPTLLKFWTEDSSVVEMVLLGMSSVLDIVRIGCYSIWRYKGDVREWGNSGRIYKELLWVQKWLRGSCCSYRSWD